MSEHKRDVREQLKKQYLGNIVRVTTKNKRIFEGRLSAVDFRCNLIVTDAIAQISQQFNVPLNYSLQNLSDGKIIYQPNPENSPQIQAERKKKYFGSHYYFGSIMIAGNDIQQILLKKQNKNSNNELKDLHDNKC